MPWGECSVTLKRPVALMRDSERDLWRVAVLPMPIRPSGSEVLALRLEGRTAELPRRQDRHSKLVPTHMRETPRS